MKKKKKYARLRRAGSVQRKEKSAFYYLKHLPTMEDGAKAFRYKK